METKMDLLANLSSVFQPLAAIPIETLLIGTVVVLSAAILTSWLVVYSGPFALRRCPVRRNRIPFYLPFVQLFLWILLAFLALTGIRLMVGSLPESLIEFAAYLVTALVEIALVAVTLLPAYFLFARRLKGFGLDIRRLPTDIPASILNFIAVLPLVWLGVIAVDLLGKLFIGPDFEIKANQGLDILTRNPQPTVRVFMLSFIILIVPVFEEFLFRGLFQSMARSYLKSAWLGIIATSLIFAMMHPLLHWPAIFILSLAIGYSYERSGSIFRPILVHVLFNTTNVCAALFAGS
jgi:membrane protease YdiL (CAAX protease family)